MRRHVAGHYRPGAHDRSASVTRPIRELKAFRKVRLAAGQSETVSFRIRRSDLLFIGQQLRPIAAAGRKHQVLQIQQQ